MLTLRDDSDQCSVSGSTLLSRRVALGCVVLGPKRMPCAYVLPHSEKKSLSGRNRPSAPDCVMSWSARWREAVRRANRRARPRGCTTAKGALPGRISPRTRIASQTTAHQSCLRGACTVEAEQPVSPGIHSVTLMDLKCQFFRQFACKLVNFASKSDAHITACAPAGVGVAAPRAGCAVCNSRDHDARRWGGGAVSSRLTTEHVHIRTWSVCV